MAIQIQSIRNNIHAEKQAIRTYTLWLTLTTDGNELRSIQHMLNEEIEHLATNEKMLVKRIQERKIRTL
jgi:rubrerythrin